MKALLAAAVLAAFSSVASAQSVCMPLEKLHHQALDKYGEAPIGQGVSSRGFMIQILVNPETGTWTVIGVQPSGRACVLDSGEGWDSQPYIAPAGVRL